MSENLIYFYEKESEDYDRIGFGAQRLPEGFVVFRQPYPDYNYFWCTETRESVLFCNHWMAFRSAWAYYREIKNEPK